MEFVIFIVLAAASVAGFVLFSKHRESQRLAAQFEDHRTRVERVMESLWPIWAAIGPYEGFEQFRNGWRIAFDVHRDRTNTTQSTEDMFFEALLIGEQAQLFNQDRNGWETKRQQTLRDHPPSPRDLADIESAARGAESANKMLFSTMKEAGILPPFSDERGAFEEALYVRWRNAWFAPPRQEINDREIEDARRRDSLELEELMDKWREVLDADVSPALLVLREEFHATREQLDEVIRRAAQLGPHANEIRSRAVHLREVLIASLLKGASDQAKPAILRAEETSQELMRVFCDPEIASLMRDDSPARSGPDSEFYSYLFSMREPSLRKLLFNSREFVNGAIQHFKRSCGRADAGGIDLPDRVMIERVLREALDFHLDSAQSQETA